MDFSFLTKTALFRGTTEEEMQSMLLCLGAYTKTYDKHMTIYRMGDTVSSLGLVLSGGVNIEIDDIWGNKSIINHIDAGQIFAETYACISGEQLLVNVVTTEKSEIIFLNTGKLIETCPTSCTHHSKLIRNLLQISAQKNLSLSRRIMHTSPKSIRERLLSYFSEQAMISGCRQFTVPFNRQGLADYLGVDRSAMSNELSKMQKDGILTYNKNTFNLK